MMDTSLYIAILAVIAALRLDLAALAVLDWRRSDPGYWTTTYR